MSRKRNSNVNRSNGFHDRSTEQTKHKPNHQNVHHEHQKNTAAEQAKGAANQERKDAQNIRNLLGLMIDRDAAHIGLTIADIFKTLTVAAAALPNMDLDTDSMYLSVDEDGIIVSIQFPKADGKRDVGKGKHGDGGHDDPGYDEDHDDFDFDDDDEEGLLYDGD